MQQEQSQHKKRLYNFATNFSGNQRHTRCIRFHSKVATKRVKNKQSLLSNESSSVEECYDASCCINYGDIRQVRVQFQSSSFQSCDFYWRKRVRRYKTRRKYKRGKNAGNLSAQEEVLSCSSDENHFKKTHEFDESNGKKT